jgi:hypothetical protein
VREEGIGLEHHVDGPLIGRQITQVLSTQNDAARRWGLETTQHTKQGGLPAAGGAQQRKNFALGQIQTHVVHSDGATAEVFDQVDDLQIVGVGGGLVGTHGAAAQWN